LSKLSRREWLAAGTAAFTGACGRKVGAGFAGYALIATSGEHDISVVDLDRFRLFKQVAVGGSPSAVIDGLQANYVLTPDTGSVHAVSRDFERVNSKKLSDKLTGLKLTPEKKHIIALSGPSREVIEADAHSLDVTRKWKLSAEPVALDIAPDGTVAVSTGAHGTVELINRQTGKILRKDLNSKLGQVLFRRDGKLLLVANCQARTLTALQPDDLQVVVELALAMEPQNLCFKPDGGQLFVTGQGMDGIAIAFPYFTLEVEQTVLGGRDPGPMACSDVPSEYLLVASASGSDVCILTVSRRKVVGIVEVGQKPSCILITPDNNYALVLNEGSGDIAVIRINSIQDRLSDAAKMRGKAGASLFTMIPVGAKPVHGVVVRKA
jgi:DNA-binding beta-propeller fold protein YncE